MRPARTFAFVLAAFVSLGAAHARAQAVAQPLDAWALLEGGGTLALSDSEVPVPAAGYQEWRALRTASGFGDAPVALDARDPETIRRALDVVGADNGLPWELALLAASVRSGVVDEPRAERWAAPLRAWADRTEVERRQTIAHAWLYDRGAAAAVLPPACLPADADGLSVLARWTEAERAVPPYRFASALDVVPELPDAATVRGRLTGQGSAAFAATRAAISAIYGADVVPPPAIASAGADGCAPAPAVFAALIPRRSTAQWATDLDALRALLETHELPEGIIVRAAVHLYLAGLGAPLDVLADGVRTSHEGRPIRHLVASLADGLRGRPESAQNRVATLTASDPFTLWVRAEAHRHNGRFEGARDVASQALDQDGLFAAALFTRAAGWIGLGWDAEALGDLQHLRLAYRASWYGGLVEALDTRLR